MKLVHPFFSAPICFQEDRIQMLVIEHAAALRKLVTELTQQREGSEGAFVLSEDNVCLDIAKHMHVILDFIHPQTLEKKLQTEAITALIHTARESMAGEIFHLAQAIQAFLGKLAALANFPVSFEQSENLFELLKAMDFRVDLNDLSPCEALYERMAFIDGLSKDQCFVLVNAKAYFSEEELLQLYDMLRYRKLNVLMIEPRAGEILPCEDIRLFDGDLCELTLDLDSKIQ